MSAGFLFVTKLVYQTKPHTNFIPGGCDERLFARALGNNDGWYLTMGIPHIGNSILDPKLIQYTYAILYNLIFGTHHESNIFNSRILVILIFADLRIRDLR